jgi:hypothetical protein
VLLWLVAILLAPVVYTLYAIARGAGVVRSREAGIAKGFVCIATFFAAAVVAICSVVEKVADATGCWLSKKVGLPYPKKTEAASHFIGA